MSSKEQKITQSELKRRISYNPTTGEFRWLIKPASHRVNVGDLAGTINAQGYRVIKLGSSLYLAHRLGWLYVYGVWPENHIDHINGDRVDNRIENLRAATLGQNARNCGKRRDNVSGIKGVSWSNRDKRWQAQIRFNGKKIYLGFFPDIDQAAKAYAEAATKYHGEFAKINPQS